MAIQDRLYTTHDLINMPDNSKTYELHDGELVERILPARKHAILSAELSIALYNYAKVHNAGTVVGSDGGYLLHTDPTTHRQTVRVPDVSFVAKARETSDADDLYIGAPDLAVEVISPSETYTIIRGKLRDYFKYGTHLMWLVYPDAKQIEVYTAFDSATILSAADTLTGGDVLPEFSVKVADIFAALDR